MTRAAVSPFAPKYQSDNYIPSAPAEKPIDLTALARVVAQSAPSLRFVAIDLSAAKGATPAERAWFRVLEHRVGGVRGVVKVSEEEGRAVAAEMRAFNRYD